LGVVLGGFNGCFWAAAMVALELRSFVALEMIL